MEVLLVVILIPWWIGVLERRRYAPMRKRLVREMGQTHASAVRDFTAFVDRMFPDHVVISDDLVIPRLNEALRRMEEQARARDKIYSNANVLNVAMTPRMAESLMQLFAFVQTTQRVMDGCWQFCAREAIAERRAEGAAYGFEAGRHVHAPSRTKLSEKLGYLDDLRTRSSQAMDTLPKRLRRHVYDDEAAVARAEAEFADAVERVRTMLRGFEPVDSETHRQRQRAAMQWPSISALIEQLES